MTDEQAIIKLGLKTGAGSSHGHGKSVYDSLDRDSRPRVRERLVMYNYSLLTVKK